jgi:hypothetical protein
MKTGAVRSSKCIFLGEAPRHCSSLRFRTMHGETEAIELHTATDSEEVSDVSVSDIHAEN